MTSISDKLDVNRVYKQAFGLKVEKTIHRVTFTPSSAKPDETLYINIPKLRDNVVIVPNSIGLLFNLSIAKGHANNTVINNLGRNLISRMKVNFGEILQDTNRYDLFQTYHDLFMTKEERENRLLEGISDLAFRKHRTAAGDRSADVKDISFAGIYGAKFRIPINHPIIDNHGVYYPRALSDTLSFEITLAPSQDIAITSDISKSYEYSLSNIELEYECITSDYLAREATSKYQVGKGYFYENVLLHKTFIISKPNDSVINEHINVPRRSMSGILLLFTDTYTAGARDSEKFVNPSITKVEINIDSLPNKLYSKGMIPTDFWQSIIKRFGLQNSITQKEFYADKFGLWIDLRTYPDNEIHGNGLPLNSTTDGVKLCINRKVGGSGNITCYIYVIADALMEIEHSNLKSVMY